MGPDSFATLSSALSAVEIFSGPERLTKPCGSIRLSFTLAQIDRKLVVSLPRGVGIRAAYLYLGYRRRCRAGSETSSW